MGFGGVNTSGIPTHVKLFILLVNTIKKGGYATSSYRSLSTADSTTISSRLRKDPRQHGFHIPKHTFLGLISTQTDCAPTSPTPKPALGTHLTLLLLLTASAARLYQHLLPGRPAGSAKARGYIGCHSFSSIVMLHLH